MLWLGGYLPAAAATVENEKNKTKFTSTSLKLKSENKQKLPLKNFLLTFIVLDFFFLSHFFPASLSYSCKVLLLNFEKHSSMSM
jgi:hypothetical protein